MSETITKKKKEYNYEAVVKRLRPLLKAYKKGRQEFYEALYDEYLDVPNFDKLCSMLGISAKIARDYFKEYDLPLKQPEKSIQMTGVSRSEFQLDESKTLIPIEQDDGSISFEEPEEPEVTVKLETDVDFARYQETYRRIRKIEELSLVDFKVGKDYRKKLIDILREASEHLIELIELLEAGNR